MLRTLPIFALALLVTLPVAARDASTDEIIARIVELQRQIDELMAQLSPEAREELRKRLAEKPSEPKPAPDATAPAPEPTVVVETRPAPSVESPTVEAPPVAAPPVAAPPVVAPPVAAPPAPPEVAPPSAPPPETAPLPRRRPRRQPCNTLQPLDENGDDKISSADRYWRYFYVWKDKNGDGQMQEREIESAYENGVREIATSLETFVRRKGSLGEIRLRDEIVLDLRGDGFGDRSRGDDGILLIDASAIQRGNGPQFLDSDGKTLSGYLALRAGLTLRLGDQDTAINCPRSQP